MDAAVNPQEKFARHDARTVKQMLRDGQEIALLDVREEGTYSKAHIFLACSAPLSRLELRVPLLVPRRSTRIVLVDEDESLAGRAATVLAANGYSNVAILAGGIPAWAKEKYPLYSGVNVPSKAFGEFVEHHYATPRMPPKEVKAALDAGEKVVILDARPLPEFRKVSIPGGIDCPGAELVYRVHDLAPSPDTLVVVNCAGRTRSIIGAQSLINAGIPNKVVALKDGTMGWHLAGFQVANNRSETAPAPTRDGLRKAREAAARVARRFGVKSVDARGLAAMRQEKDRTTYLLDVRSPEEYEAGHIPSSVSAPGGQVVQTTDYYIGTRNARVVLIDDRGVRATMTASWLIQMGWKDVWVADGVLDAMPLEKGERPLEVLGIDNADCEFVTALDLQGLLQKEQAVVIDLDTSPQYRIGHIPGAWFAIRANLEKSIGKLPGSPGMIVFTSQDGVVARLAASEMKTRTSVPVKALRDGTDKWRAQGLPLEEGMSRALDETDDVWVRAHDREKNREQAMKDYLTWEVNLVKQIEADEDANFRYFPPAAPAGDAAVS